MACAFADEEPIGTMIRRLTGDAAQDLELPVREVDEPIDFGTPDYDSCRRILAAALLPPGLLEPVPGP